MQNTTQNVSPADQKTEVKEANHPNPHHLRGQHNLNMRIDLPYNLHTLQLEGMQ